MRQVGEQNLNALSHFMGEGSAYLEVEALVQARGATWGWLTFEFTGRPQPLKAAVAFPVQRRVRPPAA